MTIYCTFSWSLIFCSLSPVSGLMLFYRLTGSIYFFLVSFVFVFTGVQSHFDQNMKAHIGFKSLESLFLPRRVSALFAGKLAPRHHTNLRLHGDYFRRDILKSSGRWRVLWKIAVLQRQEEAGVERVTYSWAKCVCDGQSSDPLASVRQLCTYNNDETLRVLKVRRDNAE